MLILLDPEGVCEPRTAAPERCPAATGTPLLDPTADLLNLVAVARTLLPTNAHICRV